jgi:hypothetical protein
MATTNHPAEAGETPQAGDTERKKEDTSSAIIGALVWLTILGFVIWKFAWTADAVVLLDISRGEAFVVTGTVVYDGKPVSDGTMHLVVANAKNKRYVSGLVVPVKAGAFTTAGQPMVPKDPASAPEPLCITADYYGSSGTGTATTYVDFAPPLRRQTLAAVGGASGILIVALLWLFTGDLTRRKARTLFAVTYLMTFLSLGVPIVLTILVSQSTYLVEMMREAPMGLVKGTAKGVTDPQWLVNIGGAVQPIPPAAVMQPATSGEPAANGPPGVAPMASTAPVADRSTSLAPTTQPAAPPSGAPSLTVPKGTTSASTEGTASASVPDLVRVVGGLAVPFYVVMLAMLGAGINMTRKVPPVQIEYENQISPDEDKFLAAAVKAPLLWFRSRRTSISPEHRKATAEIRRHLIENYMDLLSAPFLAIAVYYLLQAIGSNPAEPVLVLMAFGTGLMADALIDRIRKFARDLVADKDASTQEVKQTEKTTLIVKHEEDISAKAPPAAILGTSNVT